MTRRRLANGSWGDRINRNVYNLNSFCLDWLEFEGRFDMPKLKRCEIVPEKLFPFDERNKYREGDGAIAFYCEDGEFESVWLRANRYPHMPAIVSHAGVSLTPDFSLYTDYPVATQIWNVYRTRLLGALWQSQGIDVIPSVSWGDEHSLEWCFDGLPSGGTIAISTCHVRRPDHEGFLQGFKAMLLRCNPETVLVYGRGLKGQLEQLANVRRYDSRLTQIYEQRRLPLEAIKST